MNFDIDDDLNVEEEIKRIMNLSPDTYSKEEYWNNRYKSNIKPFEWYHPWNFFSPYVSDIIKCKGNVLNIGNGNSSLSMDLLAYEPEKVVSIDISTIVTEHMKELNKDNTKLEWVVADCRSLEFPNNYFDFAIDKGTYDSIICSHDGSDNAKKMLSEICRVLKSGSQFIEIATCAEDLILKYLTKPNLKWRITNKIPITDDHNNTITIYILQKN